jgi:hypothetical protein
MRAIVLTLIGLAACATPAPQGPASFDDFDVTEYGNEKPDDVEPTVAWGSSDDPSLFDDNLEYNVDELPLTGEAESIPWIASYWPVYQDSINHRWDGEDTKSPSEKYAEAFGVSDFVDKVSKEHGIEKYTNRTSCTEYEDCNSAMSESCGKRPGEESGYCIPTWWGICHAWAPASILEPEPEQAVTVNEVEFKVQDIKALVTLAYNRSRSRFVSLRCNEDDSEGEIEYDEYDRPTGDDEECRDTNPGTYHVLLTNFLGLKGQSFVEDRTFDDQVWNQPLRGYRITQMEPIALDRAHELIGVPDDEEPTDTVGGTYTFNADVDQGEWLHKGPYTLAEGVEIKVEMSGSEGDADLYVRVGEQPTQSDYDCRPYKPHSNEVCELSAGEGDEDLYVSVYGYGAAEFEVEVKIVDPDAEQAEITETEYLFNPDAESFYHVKLEVDYLTESNSMTDGNLAHRVDHFTKVDKYQYVLEIDDNNEIIGGEWIGTSKKNHPDFLWLPTERTNWPRPAGGSMNWDLVQDLLEQSMLEDVPEIQDGAATTKIEESFEVVRSEWRHFGPYTVAGTLKATMTGTNDADLYVNIGGQPTTTEYSCRPYSPHSNEDCSVAGPAEIYVSVRGYNIAEVELIIEFEGTADVAETEETGSTEATTHLSEADSVDFQEMALYVLAVEDGDEVRIETTGETDIDLYVRFDNPPTTNDYDARGYTSTGNEKIDFDANTTGMLHIGVHGYQAGDFTLTTSDR